MVWFYLICNQVKHNLCLFSTVFYLVSLMCHLDISLLVSTSIDYIPWAPIHLNIILLVSISSSHFNLGFLCSGFWAVKPSQVNLLQIYSVNGFYTKYKRFTWQEHEGDWNTNVVSLTPVSSSCVGVLILITGGCWKAGWISQMENGSAGLQLQLGLEDLLLISN